MAMTIEELTEYAADFLRDNYDMELAIPILRNNRLRTTMGRFIENHEGAADRIEIAGYMFEYSAREVIIDTLYHECVHYALFERGEPSDDGEPYFEAELKRLDIGATGTNIVGTYVIYSCGSCGKELKARGKRLLRDHRERMTACCLAEIVIEGERIYDGTEAIT